MTTAIFLPNWIGDTVMATPALRAMARHLGSERLLGVGRPVMAELLEGTPWLGGFLPFDPRADQSALRTMAVVRRLRERRVETVVLLTHSLRSGLMARASGARRRIGFRRNGRGWLLTERLAHRRHGWRYLPSPVLDDYLRLAKAVGCPTESPRLELATTAADELAADRLWHDLGLGPAEPVVALNSSGAFGAAKLWPDEYFAGLARRLAQEDGQRVLVLCGPAERQRAARIASLASHPLVASMADACLGIGLSKACVRRSRLLVTTDSGPRHFAAAFGVPVVTLFGPTHIAWSETHYPAALHLQRAVPCGPCQKRACPLGHHRCMRELGVDEVLAAARRHAREHHRPQAA